MNEEHYGWVVNTHYDWVNMLNLMKNNKPKRFEEFHYTNSTIYHYLSRIQHEQYTLD